MPVQRMRSEPCTRASAFVHQSRALCILVPVHLIAPLALSHLRLLLDLFHVRKHEPIASHDFPTTAIASDGGTSGHPTRTSETRRSRRRDRPSAGRSASSDVVEGAAGERRDRACADRRRSGRRAGRRRSSRARARTSAWSSTAETAASARCRRAGPRDSAARPRETDRRRRRG